jgi:catalase (peroxidase I)
MVQIQRNMGPEPSAGIEEQGLGWKNSFRTGKAKILFLVD